ncbi:MAG: BON domain-containing protein [Acidobacteria bacterium]|nr:BON domain-containing protein [Acidobacteriota bacterium]MYJ06269.1 BON domain-containing protein [Acidobacteriota bacterium]
MRSAGSRFAASVVLAALLHVGAAPARPQPPTAVVAAVEEALREERGLRDLEVAVDGGDVTLAGEVATFWLKHAALQRALNVPGVRTVVSEITVPAGETDARLAEEVGRVLRNYPDMTVWDFVGASVDRGVVTLAGWVTPELDKAGEIFERIARLRGVQDIRNGIEPLPATLQDDRLRQAIRRRVFGSLTFMRFAGPRPPPFRILVSNGSVTLAGYVQNDLERRELELMVGEIQGVGQISNQLQSLR